MSSRMSRMAWTMSRIYCFTPSWISSAPRKRVYPLKSTAFVSAATRRLCAPTPRCYAWFSDARVQAPALAPACLEEDWWGEEMSTDEPRRRLVVSRLAVRGVRTG